MRKKIVAGNWKMNMNLTEGIKLAITVKELFNRKNVSKVELVLCPPFIHLSSFEGLLKDSTIAFGAQNCSSETAGAFTGEVSADMIKSTGATYVILGHSERRIYQKENDSLLNKKTKVALKAGLKVIFCCGELLPEREAGKHFDVVRKQLEEGLFDLTEEEFDHIIVAYEPVWAIGTGLNATPQQAQEMHRFIRELISGKYGKTCAGNTSILYGGSCKPSNAAELFEMPDVDGGLIGGASLKSEDFIAVAVAV